jgi:hypothetical protein
MSEAPPPTSQPTNSDALHPAPEHDSKKSNSCRVVWIILCIVFFPFFFFLEPISQNTRLLASVVEKELKNITDLLKA